MSAQLTREGIPGWTTERTSSAGHGRLRGWWQRIRMTVQEMNYAAGRVVAVSVDDQWPGR